MDGPGGNRKTIQEACAVLQLRNYKVLCIRIAVVRCFYYRLDLKEGEKSRMTPRFWPENEVAI